MKKEDLQLPDIKRETRKLIDRFRECSTYFTAGGQPDPVPGVRTRLAKSWDEALKLHDSNAWVNLQTDMLNAMGRAVMAVYEPIWGGEKRVKECERRRKLFTKAIQPAYRRALKTLAQYVDPKHHHLDEWIQGNWLICIEASEVSQALPNRFFEFLAEVYFAGHLPCGFKGKDIDTGTFIIY